MMAGRTGSTRFVSPATQTAMIAGYTVIPYTGWGVMIPKPLSELRLRVQANQRTVWFVIGLTLLAAGVLGWFVSRWLTVIGYRGVAHDLSERVYLQEERQRQGQKMEAIGTLAGGIAHDFNNILNIIMGFAQLTTVEASEHESIQRNAHRTLLACQRAKELVRQILTFGRKSERKREPVALYELVTETLKLLRASLPAHIDIRHDTRTPTDTIHADPTQIQQVLLNLCTNAEYAMRETGGVLTLTVDAVLVDSTFDAAHTVLRPGPHVRLTVHDTGGGISPETLARIFEPFFTTKEARQGAGMGLAIVHGIVASHSGVVTVQSTTTDGTTFVLYFPQVGEHPTPTDIPHRLAVHGSEHLLFVDDEADTALAMQELLAHLGYETVVCTTSIEALAISRAAPQRFDLVITDQTMPKMTGKTLTQELRRIRPDVPIILCTGFSHIIDAAEAEALGIDAFLMKTLAIGDLSHTIQDVLARRTA